MNLQDFIATHSGRIVSADQLQLRQIGVVVSTDMRTPDGRDIYSESWRGAMVIRLTEERDGIELATLKPSPTGCPAPLSGWGRDQLGQVHVIPLAIEYPYEC